MTNKPSDPLSQLAELQKQAQEALQPAAALIGGVAESFPTLCANGGVAEGFPTRCRAIG